MSKCQPHKNNAKWSFRSDTIWTNKWMKLERNLPDCRTMSIQTVAGGAIVSMIRIILGHLLLHRSSTYTPGYKFNSLIHFMHTVWLAEWAIIQPHWFTSIDLCSGHFIIAHIIHTAEVVSWGFDYVDLFMNIYSSATNTVRECTTKDRGRRRRRRKEKEGVKGVIYLTE